MQYEGQEVWINKVTGETRTIDMFVKDYEEKRNGFIVAYLGEIINMMESLGNKKMQVVKYILENIEGSNNALIITTRELAKKSGVSLNVVVRTLKLLDEKGIIQRRTGSLMLNPKFCNRWKANKERAMMIKFQGFSNKE